MHTNAQLKVPSIGAPIVHWFMQEHKAHSSFLHHPCYTIYDDHLATIWLIAVEHCNKLQKCLKFWAWFYGKDKHKKWMNKYYNLEKRTWSQKQRIIWTFWMGVVGSSSKGGNISVMSPRHHINDVIRKWKISIKITSKSSKSEPWLFNNVLQLTWMNILKT
jgi:hypothetical protein